MYEAKLWVKISEYVEELLLDERRTLDDLNKNSLSFRQSFSAVSLEKSATKDVNPGVRKKIRWSKRYDAKLKVMNKGYRFDMLKMVIFSMIIILPLVCFQLMEYFNSTSSSKQIANVLNLYSTMVDLWSNNMLMKLSVFSALFNSEARYLNSTSTKNTNIFASVSRKLSKQLIPDLISMQTRDFGTDFNSIYTNLVSSQSVCQILVRQNKTLPGCGTGDLAYLNQTVENYLKWSISISRDSMFILDLQSNKTLAMGEILANRQFGSYLNQSLDGGAEREIYYAIMMPLANTIKVLIDPSVSVGGSTGSFTMSADQTKSEDYYLFFVIPLSIATLGFLVRFVYSKLVWTYTAFWKTTLLIPVELIVKNPLLTKHLRSVEISTKSRISFF